MIALCCTCAQDSASQGSDTLLGVVAVVGIVLTALNVFREFQESRRNRVKWMQTLFEKFYEQVQYKTMRKKIDHGELTISTLAASSEEEELVDYLNFFEFIASLNARGHIKREEIYMLFGYYLDQLRSHQVIKPYIDNKANGFDRLRDMLGSNA